MGGQGFGQGLVQGMQQAQDRQLQFQELKLRQDHSKALLKSMEAEDQMKQLQLQSLQRKIQDEMTQREQVQAIPGQMQDVMGGQLGPGEFGPPQDIDRNKLTSLLLSAQQAGQDPNQLLSLMAMSDPRIAAIQQSLQPRKVSKVGEGEKLVEEATGRVVAEGRPKAHTLAPGGSLVREGEETIVAPPGPTKPPDFGDRTESAAAVYGQQKFGKPMTFSELLATDPIEAGKIRQQTMVDEPATIAAGKLAATIPERKAELLTPSEANELGVPFGTTKGQAEGIMPITAQQRAVLAGFDTTRAVIADIRQYSEKVNTAAGGLKGKADQARRLWGAWTQSDMDATMLQSKAGELATIARSLGEKGALADKDIARAAALVPSVMDTREVAVKKINDMISIIDQGEANFRKSLGIDARQPAKSTGKPQAPKAAAPDPSVSQMRKDADKELQALQAIPTPPGLTPQQEQVYREAYAAEKAKKQQQMKPKTATPKPSTPGPQSKMIPTADEEAVEDPLLGPGDFSPGKMGIAALKGLGIGGAAIMGSFKVTSPHHGSYYADTIEGAKKLVQMMRDNTPWHAADRIRPKIIDLDDPKVIAARRKRLEKFGYKFDEKTGEMIK